MDFASVLEKITGYLAGSGHRYAVVGGHGLAAYGQPRATLDLDLVVDGQAQEGLIAFLESEGYATLHRSTGYSNHLHPRAERGRVDFIYVRGSTADELFASCREAAGPAGTRVPIPRPEHLVAMKVVAMKNDPRRRHQELADIQALMGLPGVDLNQIRGYFERHGLAEDYDELAQRD